VQHVREETAVSSTIALIGLMGTGKSTIGRILAARLSRPFLDNDALLAERFGGSASEQRSQFGLPELHRREAEVLTDLLERPEPCVINAAASTVDDAVLRRRLHDHAFVVWLTADPMELARRVATGPPRPALTAEPLPTARDIEALAARRHDAFSDIADYVLDTTTQAPDRSADDIVAALSARDEAERGR
jgi:shikimate kinase